MSLKDKVLEILNENTSEVGSSLFHGYKEESEEVVEQLSKQGIALENVAQFGGEGEGEKYYSVWKFNKGDETVHVQLDGWYASHSGSEMTNVFEVEPKQVVRTEYYRVK